MPVFLFDGLDEIRGWIDVRELVVLVSDIRFDKGC